MLTVKKLKLILSRCQDSDVVILSTDEEGNSYSPMASFMRDLYSGSKRELIDEGKYGDYVSAVIFYPVD